MFQWNILGKVLNVSIVIILLLQDPFLCKNFLSSNMLSSAFALNMYWFLWSNVVIFRNLSSSGLIGQIDPAFANLTSIKKLSVFLVSL